MLLYYRKLYTHLVTYISLGIPLILADAIIAKGSLPI